MTAPPQREPEEDRSSDEESYLIPVPPQDEGGSLGALSVREELRSKSLKRYGRVSVYLPQQPDGMQPQPPSDDGAGGGTVAPGRRRNLSSTAVCGRRLKPGGEGHGSDLGTGDGSTGCPSEAGASYVHFAPREDIAALATKRKPLWQASRVVDVLKKEPHVVQPGQEEWARKREAEKNDCEKRRAVDLMLSGFAKGRMEKVFRIVDEPEIEQLTGSHDEETSRTQMRHIVAEYEYLRHAQALSRIEHHHGKDALDLVRKDMMQERRREAHGTGHGEEEDLQDGINARLKIVHGGRVYETQSIGDKLYNGEKEVGRAGMDQAILALFDSVDEAHEASRTTSSGLPLSSSGGGKEGTGSDKIGGKSSKHGVMWRDEVQHGDGGLEVCSSPAEGSAEGMPAEVRGEKEPALKVKDAVGRTRGVPYRTLMESIMGTGEVARRALVNMSSSFSGVMGSTEKEMEYLERARALNATVESVKLTEQDLITLGIIRPDQLKQLQAGAQNVGGAVAAGDGDGKRGDTTATTQPQDGSVMRAKISPAVLSLVRRARIIGPDHLVKLVRTVEAEDEGGSGADRGMITGSVLHNMIRRGTHHIHGRCENASRSIPVLRSHLMTPTVEGSEEQRAAGGVKSGMAFAYLPSHAAGYGVWLSRNSLQLERASISGVGKGGGGAARGSSSAATSRAGAVEVAPKSGSVSTVYPRAPQVWAPNTAHIPQRAVYQTIKNELNDMVNVSATANSDEANVVEAVARRDADAEVETGLLSKKSLSRPDGQGAATGGGVAGAGVGGVGATGKHKDRHEIHEHDEHHRESLCIHSSRSLNITSDASLRDLWTALEQDSTIFFAMDREQVTANRAERVKSLLVGLADVNERVRVSSARSLVSVGYMDGDMIFAVRAHLYDVSCSVRLMCVAVLSRLYYIDAHAIMSLMSCILGTDQSVALTAVRLLTHPIFRIAFRHPREILVHIDRILEHTSTRARGGGAVSARPAAAVENPQPGRRQQEEVAQLLLAAGARPEQASQLGLVAALQFKKLCVTHGGLPPRERIVWRLFNDISVGDVLANRELRNASCVVEDAMERKFKPNQHGMKACLLNRMKYGGAALSIECAKTLVLYGVALEDALEVLRVFVSPKPETAVEEPVVSVGESQEEPAEPNYRTSLQSTIVDVSRSEAPANEAPTTRAERREASVKSPANTTRMWSPRSPISHFRLQGHEMSGWKVSQRRPLTSGRDENNDDTGDAAEGDASRDSNVSMTTLGEDIKRCAAEAIEEIDQGLLAQKDTGSLLEYEKTLVKQLQTDVSVVEDEQDETDIAGDEDAQSVSYEVMTERPGEAGVDIGLVEMTTGGLSQLSSDDEDEEDHARIRSQRTSRMSGTTGRVDRSGRRWGGLRGCVDAVSRVGGRQSRGGRHSRGKRDNNQQDTDSVDGAIGDVEPTAEEIAEKARAEKEAEEIRFISLGRARVIDIGVPVYGVGHVDALSLKSGGVNTGHYALVVREGSETVSADHHGPNVVGGAHSGAHDTAAICVHFIGMITPKLIPEKVIDALQLLLYSPSWRSRVEAVLALGRLGATSSSSKIVSMLYADWNVNVRRSAAIALTMLDAGRLAFATLFRRLEIQGAHSRAQAIRALVALGLKSERIVERVYSRLSDPYLPSQIEALRAIASLEIDDTKTMKAVVGKLAGGYLMVRTIAAKTIGIIGDITCAEPLIACAEQSDCEEIHCNVLDSLGVIASKALRSLADGYDRDYFLPDDSSAVEPGDKIEHRRGTTIMSLENREDTDSNAGYANAGGRRSRASGRSSRASGRESVASRFGSRPGSSRSGVSSRGSVMSREHFDELTATGCKVLRVIGAIVRCWRTSASHASSPVRMSAVRAVTIVDREICRLIVLLLKTKAAAIVEYEEYMSRNVGIAGKRKVVLERKYSELHTVYVAASTIFLATCDLLGRPSEEGAKKIMRLVGDLGNIFESSSLSAAVVSSAAPLGALHGASLGAEIDLGMSATVKVAMQSNAGVLNVLVSTSVAHDSGKETDAVVTVAPAVRPHVIKNLLGAVQSRSWCVRARTTVDLGRVIGRDSLHVVDMVCNMTRDSDAFVRAQAVRSLAIVLPDVVDILASPRDVYTQFDVDRWAWREATSNHGTTDDESGEGPVATERAPYHIVPDRLAEDHPVVQQFVLFVRMFDCMLGAARDANWFVRLEAARALGSLMFVNDRTSSRLTFEHLLRALRRSYGSRNTTASTHSARSGSSSLQSAISWKLGRGEDSLSSALIGRLPKYIRQVMCVVLSGAVLPATNEGHDKHILRRRPVVGVWKRHEFFVHERTLAVDTHMQGLLRKSISCLHGFASDPDSNVRETALRSIIHIHRGNFIADSTLIGVFSTMVRDKSYRVRALVADAAAMTLPEEGVRLVPLLMELLRDEVAGVRYHAIVSLGKMKVVPKPSHVSSLLAALSDSVAAIRCEVLFVLCNYGRAFPGWSLAVTSYESSDLFDVRREYATRFLSEGDAHDGSQGVSSGRTTGLSFDDGSFERVQTPAAIVTTLGILFGAMRAQSGEISQAPTPQPGDRMPSTMSVSVSATWKGHEALLNARVKMRSKLTRGGTSSRAESGRADFVAATAAVIARQRGMVPDSDPTVSLLDGDAENKTAQSRELLILQDVLESIALSLADPTCDVRFVAAYSLVRCGVMTAPLAMMLLQYFVDKSCVVRLLAVTAVGATVRRLRTSGARKRRQGSNPSRRLTAKSRGNHPFWALDDQVTRALSDRLFDKYLPVRRMAGRALMKMDAVDKAVELVVTTLKSEGSPRASMVYACEAAAFMRFSQKKVLSALTMALSHNMNEVRCAAVKAIMFLGLRDEVTARLVDRLVTSVDPKVKAKTFTSIVSICWCVVQSIDLYVRGIDSRQGLPDNLGQRVERPGVMAAISGIIQKGADREWDTGCESLPSLGTTEATDVVPPSPFDNRERGAATRTTGMDELEVMASWWAFSDEMLSSTGMTIDALLAGIMERPPDIFHDAMVLDPFMYASSFRRWLGRGKLSQIMMFHGAARHLLADDSLDSGLAWSEFVGGALWTGESSKQIAIGGETCLLAGRGSVRDSVRWWSYVKTLEGFYSVVDRIARNTQMEGHELRRGDCIPLVPAHSGNVEGYRSCLTIIRNTFIGELRASDVHTRVLAKEALMRWGCGDVDGRRRVVKLLVGELDAADWRVRLQAAKDLGDLCRSSMAATACLVDRLSTETEHAVRAALLEAVGRVGNETWTLDDLLVDLADDEDAAVRAAVLSVIKTLKVYGTRATLVIRAGMSDRSPAVRLQAVKTLRLRGLAASDHKNVANGTSDISQGESTSSSPMAMKAGPSRAALPALVAWVGLDSHQVGPLRQSTSCLDTMTLERDAASSDGHTIAADLSRNVDNLAATGTVLPPIDGTDSLTGTIPEAAPAAIDLEGGDTFWKRFDWNNEPVPMVRPEEGSTSPSQMSSAPGAVSPLALKGVSSKVGFGSLFGGHTPVRICVPQDAQGRVRTLAGVEVVNHTGQKSSREEFIRAAGYSVVAPSKKRDNDMKRTFDSSTAWKRDSADGDGQLEAPQSRVVEHVVMAHNSAMLLPAPCMGAINVSKSSGEHAEAVPPSVPDTAITGAMIKQFGLPPALLWGVNAVATIVTCDDGGSGNGIATTPPSSLRGNAELKPENAKLGSTLSSLTSRGRSRKNSSVVGSSRGSSRRASMVSSRRTSWGGGRRGSEVPIRLGKSLGSHAVPDATLASMVKTVSSGTSVWKARSCRRARGSKLGTMTMGSTTSYAESGERPLSPSTASTCSGRSSRSSRMRGTRGTSFRDRRRGSYVVDTSNAWRKCRRIFLAALVVVVLCRSSKRESRLHVNVRLCRAVVRCAAADPDHAVRAEACRALQVLRLQGRRVETALLACLSSVSSVCTAATWSVAQLGMYTDRIVVKLVHCLPSRSHALRAAACVALGRYRVVRMDVIKGLIARLHDWHPAVICRAAEALVEIGIHARPSHVGEYDRHGMGQHDAGNNTSFRVGVLDIDRPVELGLDEDVLDTIGADTFRDAAPVTNDDEALREHELERKACVARVTETITLDEARAMLPVVMETLVGRLDDPDASVQHAAVCGMRVLLRGTYPPPFVMARLLQYLVPSATSGSSIATGAGTSGMLNRGADALASMSGHGSSMVGEATLHGAVNPKAKASGAPAGRVDADGPFVSTGSAVPVRVTIIDLLAANALRMDPVQVGDMMIRMTRDPAADVRAAAVRALGAVEYPTGAMLTTVQRCWADEDPCVRLHAQHTLERIGEPFVAAQLLGVDLIRARRDAEALGVSKGALNVATDENDNNGLLGVDRSGGGGRSRGATMSGAAASVDMAVFGLPVVGIDMPPSSLYTPSQSVSTKSDVEALVGVTDAV